MTIAPLKIAEVFIDFKSRAGAVCVPTPAQPCEYSVQAGPAGFGNTYQPKYGGCLTFKSYTFEITMPTNVGVSSFTVRLEDGTNVIQETNGGHGFPFDDTLQPQLGKSCWEFSFQNATGAWRNITVAVSPRMISIRHTTPRSNLSCSSWLGARRSQSWRYDPVCSTPYEAGRFDSAPPRDEEHHNDEEPEISTRRWLYLL